MTNYAVTTNFAAKDALISGNPLKTIKGFDLTTEFNNIATAVGTKADVVAVTQYGADPTGVADSTTAFVNAIAFSQFAGNLAVVVPAGVYKITGNVGLNYNGLTLSGSGRGCTTINISTAASPGFVLGANVSNVTIRDMTINRTVTATAGGTGIDCSAITNLVFLQNLNITRQWIGLKLGSQAYGLVNNVTIQYCLNDGIYMSNSASSAPLQWDLQTLVIQFNAGRGITCQGVATSGTRTTLGNWCNIGTYQNSSNGAAIIGVSTTFPIEDIRIFDSYFSYDGNSALYLQTYGSQCQLSNCFFEYAGQSVTGPTGSTAASNIGYGVEINAATVQLMINGCHASNNAYDGFYSGAAVCQLNGCRSMTNGAAAVAGFQNGIHVVAGMVMANACRCANLAPATLQLYGIYLGVDGSIITSCNLVGNQTGPIFYNTFPPPASVVFGNLPVTMTNYVPNGTSFAATVGTPAAGTVNVGVAVQLNSAVYTNP